MMTLYMRCLSIVVGIVLSVELAWTDSGDPTFDASALSALLKVQEGEDAVLECTVVNLGAHRVVWQRLGVTHNSGGLISMQTEVWSPKKYQLEGDLFNTTFNLRIKNVKREDKGIYACRISTEPTISWNVTLTVEVPTTIIGPVQNDSGKMEDYNSGITRFVYNESDTVAILCEVDGEPPPQVEWKRVNGTMPSQNDRDQYSPWLLIYKITRQDSGIYICRADNSVGPSIVEQRIELVAQYKPTVTVRKPDIRRAHGGYVTLECLVDSYPRSRYEWRMGNDDQLIPEYRPKSTNKGASTSIRIPLICYENKTRLIIISVDSNEDYGNYTCTATNDLGADSGVIEVSGRPRAPRVLSSPTGLRRYEYTLRWDFGEIFPGDPAFIEVEEFVVLYRGWWEEVTKDDKLRITYSNEMHLEKSYRPGAKYRLPLQMELKDLKSNINYEVRIYGRNQHGAGNIAEFNFTTSKKDTIVNTTPLPFNYGPVSGQDYSRPRLWLANSAPNDHHNTSPFIMFLALALLCHLILL